jgi:hypothetical protein
MSTGGAPPPLIIPIRFDMSQISAQLKQLQAAAGQTTQQFKQGQQAAKAMGNEVADLMKGQMILSTMRQVVGAIGQQMKEVADYTHQAAENFVTMHKGMLSIAGLMDKLPTKPFVLEQVELGRQARQTPEEWTRFQDAFLAKANLYIGKITPGGTAKITPEDATKLEQSVAEFAKLKNIDPKVVADYVGGLVAMHEGPTNFQEMIEEFGQTFKGLEMSSKDVAQLLDGMTRIMALGLTSRQAAAKLAMMPEISPAEESTHLAGVFRAVDKVMISGRGAQYGLVQGAGLAQNLENMVANLRKRATVGGKIDENLLAKIIDGVVDERIAQSTLRKMVLKPEGAFKMWTDVIGNVPAGAVRKEIEERGATEMGARMKAEAEAAASKEREAAPLTPIQIELMNAETRLRDAGRFTNKWWVPGDVVRGAISGVTGGAVPDAWKQAIQEEAIYNLEQRAGVEHEYQPGMTGQFLPRSTLSANERIQELLRKIETNTGKNAQAANEPINLTIPAGGGQKNTRMQEAY